MRQLPIELWQMIALIDSDTYNLVVRLHSILYDWTINPTTQKKLKRLWTHKLGSTYYLPNGWLHRDDGPAYIDSDSGWHYWYQNNLLHREDGPAIESPVYTEWRFNGQLHRDDGPAIDGLNRKEWWVNGQLHRERGPAIIGNIYTEYHVTGVFIYRKFYQK